MITNMNKINGPNPNTLYPMAGMTRTVFLKNIIKNPQIIVGDYTYYDDPEDVCKVPPKVEVRAAESRSISRKTFFISSNLWAIGSLSGDSVKLEQVYVLL